MIMCYVCGTRPYFREHKGMYLCPICYRLNTRPKSKYYKEIKANVSDLEYIDKKSKITIDY